MDSFLEPPPTIIGDDGVLRSAEQLDEADLPVIKESIVSYIIEKIKEKIGKDGDGEMLADGSAGNLSL